MKTINGLCMYITKIAFSTIILDASVTTEYFVAMSRDFMRVPSTGFAF